MKNRDEILTELCEIAPKLAGMEKKNPFTAPDGYFLNFKNSVLEQVRMNTAIDELHEIAPVLAKVAKTNNVEIPSNYFSAFSGGLIQKIRAAEVANELSVLAPELSKLEKTNVVEAPANYFSAFPQQMLKHIHAEEKAAAISSSPKWIGALNNALDGIANVIFKPKYSMAFAGIASVLIVGFMLFNKVEQPVDLNGQLAQVSNEELNTYFIAHSDELYNDILDVTPADANTLNQINSDGNMEQMLMDVSDEELSKSILD